MAARKFAGAEAVRSFAREKGMEGAFTKEVTRGRLPQAAIEAFEKETGLTYKPGHKVEKSVTLTVSKVDSKGRRSRRKVTKTLSEFRALAGDLAGSRGVPSKAAIEAVEASLSDPLTEAEVAKAAAEVAKAEAATVEKAEAKTEK